MIHQALCGLSHAHQSGVVHGYLTPADLIVDDSGKAGVILANPGGFPTGPAE